MTSKEKKEYIALVGILALIIIVLGFYFFGGSRTPNLIPPPRTILTGSITDSGAPIQGGTSALLLPNGADIDLTILNDPRFKSLVPPQYPQVTKSEIGSPNPFK